MDRLQVLDRVSSELGDLLCLLRRAGEEVLSVYAGEFDVELKTDLSPLTLADRRSHEILSGGLPGVLPWPVLSEEGASIPYRERSSWKGFWSIDPLDGTKEFVKRSGDFCISVGLVSGRSPVFGVIYIPVTNEIFFGGEEFGAYRLPGTEIAALEGRTPEEILRGCVRLDTPEKKEDHPEKDWILLGSVSHGAEIPADLLNNLARKARFDSFSVGSAIKFCRIAEGAADFYPRYGTTMEWDTSAGQAIVCGSGGGVVSIPDRRPLRYNKEFLENPDFYCFGSRFRRIFPEILGLSSPENRDSFNP